MPWDEPFDEDVKAISAAAQAVTTPADASVVTLLEEHHFAINARGLTTMTFRRVYRILKQDSIPTWATVEQEYQPWYEDRPQLRARVISSTGNVHPLSPATIAEAPTTEFDASLFTDSRVVKAPLPAVEIGSIVEVEIVVRQKQPLLGAGYAHRVYLMDFVPVERFHLLIEADKQIPLKIASKGFPEGSLKQTQTGKGSVVECELHSIKPNDKREDSVPFDTPVYPYVSFSTGASWQAVAAEYHQIVEKTLAAGPAPNWLDTADKGLDPLAVVQSLSARLHKEIRYTGVEFGEAAIVPRTPAETLERRYGDCKDKSTLLVGALRAAGLKAYLALLASGYDTDVDPDLPGLGRFNHAIVYVDANPPLWIDATAENFRVGTIPSANQGRLALIIRPESTALVTMPESNSADNWRRHTVEMRMAEYGRGTVEESIEAAGEMEAQLRMVYGVDNEQSRKLMEEYVKSNFAGKLESFSTGNAADTTSPFRVRVSATGIQAAVTGLDDAAAAILPFRVFEDLPYAFQLDPEEDESPRKADYMLPGAHRVEYRCRIHLPKQFKTGILPGPVEARIGGGTYTKTYTFDSNGVLEVVSRLDTGDRRMSPEAFQAFRDGVLKYRTEAAEMLTFIPETSELLALGKTTEALDLVEHLVRAQPESAIAYIRRSKVLLALGLGMPARHDARKATELEPALPASWFALGLSAQCSSFGRPFEDDWDRHEAEQAYRKALELNPKDFLVQMSLAILLEHDARGFRYTTGEQLNESISLYRAILKDQPHPVVDQNLALTLFYAGQFDDALKQARKCKLEVLMHLELLVAGATKGAAAVLTDPRLSAQDANSRAALYNGVANVLLTLRRYEDANSLMTAAARLTNSPDSRSLSGAFSGIKHYTEALAPPTDPRYPIQQLIVHAVLGTLDKDTVQPLLSSRMQWNGDLALFSLEGHLRNTRREFFGRLNLSSQAILDFAVSGESSMKGDPEHGYRFAPAYPGFPAYYVAREDEQYRLIGLSDNMAGVAEHILALAEQKDVAGAQWWLDQILPSLQPLDGGSTRPAVQVLWSGVGETARGPAAIRLAAASLMGAYAESQKALDILRDGRSKAASDYDRGVLDLAIAECLAAAKRWKELLPIAKQLAQRKTYFDRGLKFAEMAAVKTGNWEELENIAAMRLLDNKTDPTAISMVATARARMSDIRSALEWSKKLNAEGSWGWDALLLESWISMYAGASASETIERFQNHSAVRSDGGNNADVQITLAMLQATTGHVGEAIHSIARASALEHPAPSNARTWAVYSKICQKLGFSQAASEALERARAKSTKENYSEWALAIASTGN